MRRRAFDTIFTAGGLVLTVVLIVAGGLLLWGAHFANSNVHDQLAEQQIFFPAKGSPALAPKEIGPYLNKYAGQQLTTGQQAEAYANHFIRVHLSEVAGGQTYAQVSTKSQANPNDAKLAAQVQTLFRGETLRGLLLSAYAFWKIGYIAHVASVVSFILAGVMAVLTALGVWHLRKVAPDAAVFEGQTLQAAA
ncbi:MAG TPA: hypothetical protein VFA84_10340 [Acidimicrobiales bacterium]|nr:hypothetical protein [Acidimicrobiales bacterium]